jgi:hypothetical protein
MAFGLDGTIYLVGNDSTGVIGTARIVKGARDIAGSDHRAWSLLAETVPFPYGNVYNHRMSGIVVNLHGDSLYVNSGAATDHGELRDGNREVGLTSVILKLPVNGQNITLPDNRDSLRSLGYLLAEGNRNTFDFAYAGNGDLFGVDNSGDRDDPDEMNWIREGHHYGFPWRMGQDNTPQQFTPYAPKSDPLLNSHAWGGGNLYATFSNDPGYPHPPDSVTFTDPVLSHGPDADKFRDTLNGTVKDASDLGLTIPTFTSHRSPDGIVFDRDSVLAGDLMGGAFVICLATGVPLTALGDDSQDLLHVALTRVGDHYEAQVTKLVTGLNSPLGIELVGNKLFVMETGLEAFNPAPKLWEIVLPKKAVTSVSHQQEFPNTFALLQNYPNPFNPATAITFSVPVDGPVQISVYSVLGQPVRTLLSGNVAAGSHTVQWDGNDSRGRPVGSGTYFYRFSSPSGYTATRRMILLR